MSDPKDPAIKLFGMTIPVPEISASSPSSTVQQSDSNPGGDRTDADKDAIGEKPMDNKQENDALTLISEESSNPDATSDNTVSTSLEKGDTSKAAQAEVEHSDSSNSQEKTLKKPDKILPCPRCNSMDTKFCYYNNYNVNQPRHFCKNCQRYWTAGGTMRNVPVGAGRRKNKTSASHYRHITVSEALQNVRTDIPNGVNHNGTVLTFGSDPPLHESMASVLKLADKTMQDRTRNGYHRPEALQIPNGSSEMASNSKEEASKDGTEERMMQNFPGFQPCFPGAPWPYAWNAIPPPGFFPPGYPMPFCPTPAYWSFPVPGAWNMPWVPRPNPEQAAPSSGPNSPTLGKHSREESTAKQGNNGEEPVKEKNGERCLWIPKTLRIDDPGEAAKSSIWTTLGIKHDKTESIGGRGLKRDEKNHKTEASSVLQANPAALSRSVKFHERS